jgi:hypothetical protein
MGSLKTPMKERKDDPSLCFIYNDYAYLMSEKKEYVKSTEFFEKSLNLSDDFQKKGGFKDNMEIQVQSLTGMAHILKLKTKNFIF